MRAAWLAALLLVPAVAAEAAEPVAAGIVNPNGVSTPVTLYFHVIDPLNEIYINTQEPQMTFQRDPGVGVASSSLTCFEDVYSGSQNWHHYYAISSPSYVQYNLTDSQGNPRTHPERAIPWDIRPDTAAPFRLHWYVSVDSGLPQAEQTPAPAGTLVVLPDIAVHAWMRSGEDISIGDEGYRSGTLLAEGETVGNLGGDALTETTSPSGEVVWHDVVDEQGYHRAVYEYTLDLAWQPGAIIPAQGGYNVQVAVFLKGACDDPSRRILAPGQVGLYPGPAFWNRMELAIFDAVRILEFAPRLVGDDLIVLLSSQSVFGNYDIDESTTGGPRTQGGLSLSIEGPSPATSLQRIDLVQRYYEHDHKTDPVDAWYVWNLTQDQAQDGTYTLRASATNDQHTATATAVTTFILGKPVKVTACAVQENASVCREQVATPDGKLADVPVKASPGLGLAAVAALVVAAVLSRRARFG